MEAAVNSLPTEILEKIFLYCTPRDLVHSIENVCRRWREVAQSTRLWKDVCYCPERYTRYEQVVEMLKISPKLQNITLRKEFDDRVLQAITDNCAELRKLKLNEHPELDLNFLKNLKEKCSKLQYLSFPHRVLTDFSKCEVVGKFTNLKVLHLTAYAPTCFLMNLKPIADYCKALEDLEIRSNMFDMKDLHHLLSMRKDTMHTLGISCCNKSDECVLPAVSTCELKSLSLFNYCDCPRHDEKTEHLGRLKTVRILSIKEFYSENVFDDLKQIFENENLAQLVELKIEDSFYFDDNITEVVVRNCPLLKCLSLIGCYNVTNASLEIIANLKELNSLTVSDADHVTDRGLVLLKAVKDVKCQRMPWWEIVLG